MTPSPHSTGHASAAAAPSVAYYGAPAELPASVLGAVVYGCDARAVCAALADPRLVCVPLETLPGSARVEAWHTRGPVTTGERAGVRFCASEDHCFGVIELEEAPYGGPRGAAREAYQRVAAFHAGGDHPYVWRIWNFLDAINQGDGDAERYKLFCLGRAAGLGESLRGYPAGSALGRRDGDRRVQVVWLAGREPGSPVENPRQVSAFRYPRRYGLASPSFSRAMRLGADVLISGTASIVGHETVHPGNLQAQLHECIDNLTAVSEAAAIGAPHLTALKAYVRHAGDAEAVASAIRARCRPDAASCILLADICRADLLVELEAIGRPRWLSAAEV